VSHKKIQRLWREKSLQVPRQRRRKRLGTSSAPNPPTADAPDWVWRRTSSSTPPRWSTGQHGVRRRWAHPRAADLLANAPPPAVTLGQVRYHPEAIMLGVAPAERWRRSMTPRTRQPIRSPGRTPDRRPARWRPHVTICYSTSRQPAKPIIDALGTRLPGCDIDIRALRPYVV